MGLFDKKNCAICGKEIRFLGNVKLEDGNMCRECSGKLSPFFTGRKKTTVKEIEEQLAYREKNQEALKNFNPDVTIGSDTKVLIESKTGNFVVSDRSDWRKNNPDLITRAMLNACDIEVKENEEEIYKTNEAGEEVSYEPKRYEYDYEFIAHLLIESPYFERISFELSDEDNRPTSDSGKAFREMEALGRKLQATLMPDKYTYEEEDDAGASASSSSKDDEEWACECGAENVGGKFCSKCGKPKPSRWFCPDCGKENYGQFCIDCGRKKPE